MTDSAATVAPLTGRTAWARNLEAPLRDVPAHRDRQRGGAARRGGGRAGLGERRRGVVRERLGHRAVDPARRAPASRRPARVGQHGPDDVLLLRRRARGAARVRHGRAARAAAAGAAAARRRSAAWRVPVAIYLAFNAGARRRARLGRGDVDRHRVRARHARAGRAAASRDRLRAFLLTVAVVDDVVALRRDRGRLQRARSASGRCSSALGVFAVVLVVRARGVAQRRRLRRCSASPPGWRSSSRASTRSSSGSRSGCSTFAYPAGARRPRAGDRPVPAVPRAADRRAGPLGAGRASRAAISPNERLQQLYHPWTSYVIVPLFALANAGIAIDGRFLARAFTSPITLGHPGRLRGRQAGRDRRARRGWSTRLSRGRLRPPVGWAAVARRRRDRRHRLHRLAADRDARLPRRRAARRRSSACSPPRVLRLAAHLARLPRDRACCRRRLRRPRAARHGRDDRRPRRAGRPRARPHPRPGATRRSRSSSTATSSARTAARPSRSSASCSPTSATSATSGATCR